MCGGLSRVGGFGGRGKRGAMPLTLSPGRPGRPRVPPPQIELRRAISFFSRSWIFSVQLLAVLEKYLSFFKGSLVLHFPRTVNFTQPAA